MASKIPKPVVSHALFIHNDIYEFWIDYEKEILSQYALDRMLGMKHAVHFLNNEFAPDYLRNMFVTGSLAKYAPTLSASLSPQANVNSSSQIVSSWHPLLMTTHGEITTSHDGNRRQELLTALAAFVGEDDQGGEGGGGGGGGGGNASPEGLHA